MKHSKKQECGDILNPSTPNAAGAVACLLPNLKANSIPYSLCSVKFTLFKAAKLPENGNKLEFGHGIFQIDDAFEYCRKNGMDATNFWLMKGNANLFVLQKIENPAIRTFFVDLPFLADTVTDEQVKWILQLSPNVKNVIEISEADSNHSFSVKIDTSKIELGDLYFSEIEVFHPINPSFGPIFNIPVTVIVPLQISETHNYRIQKEITLNYEKPEYIFFNPVFESSNKKCKIRITALEKNIKTYLCIQIITRN